VRDIGQANAGVFHDADCAGGVTAADRFERVFVRLLGILPLLILPVTALLVRSWTPRWVFMWTMAFALYAGCKWLTFYEAQTRGASSGRLRALGYLLACGDGCVSVPPRKRAPCPATPIRVGGCGAQDVLGTTMEYRVS
jgi:hypothetical protein